VIRADRISEPEVTYQIFAACPSDLVNGVCPDARAPTAASG
jgi:hypothetical protein